MSPFTFLVLRLVKLFPMMLMATPGMLFLIAEIFYKNIKLNIFNIMNSIT